MDIKDLLPILNDRDKYNLVQVRFDNGGGYNCFEIDISKRDKFFIEKNKEDVLLLGEDQYYECRFSLDLSKECFVFYNFLQDKGYIEYGIPLKAGRDVFDSIYIKLIVRLEKR